MLSTQIGSPVTLPKVALVDGVPYLYSAGGSPAINNVDQIPASNDVGDDDDNQSNSVVDGLANQSDTGPGLILPETEQKRSALRFAIARRSNGIKVEPGPDEKVRKLEKYTPALSVG